MMTTKYVIQLTMATRPDLEYFYAGQGRSGFPVFELKKHRAKGYDFFEEADRDMRVLQAFLTDDSTLKVITVRRRT